MLSILIFLRLHSFLTNKYRFPTARARKAKINSVKTIFNGFGVITERMGKRKVVPRNKLTEVETKDAMI
jgi:hypothetical protein